MSDQIQRFLLEHSDVRGACIQLRATWRAVLERRDYPEPVREVLGQALAAVALLGTTLKLDGMLTLQMECDGPLSFLVVQRTGQRTLRGLARWEGEDLPSDWASLVGTGRIAMTIEPASGRERYQGVVDVEGESLASALERYFRQSEQLDTRLWLAADGGVAAGLLLQRLPGRESEDADAWNRMSHLAATVRERELLELPQLEVLHRLFHEEDIRAFDPDPVAFRCTCSRERIEAVLLSMGADDVRTLLQEQGEVLANCEFCGHEYRFDAVDVERVLAGKGPAAPRTLH